MTERITGTTKMIGLLGSPISHSTSPLMHNKAFVELGLDYVYVAFDVGHDNLEKAVAGFRALGVKGFNVTMPNKTLVHKYLDEVSLAAEMSQSVNTVVREDDKLIGHNTDGYGFMESLRINGLDPRGKKMTIIGTGGASTAICAQAALDGMREISIFGIDDPTFALGERMVEVIHSKTDCKAKIFYLSDAEMLKQQISESDVLANATPVGMGRMTGKSAITDESVFFPGLIVSDVIYNPRKSKLLEIAESHGCKIINGLDMVLCQGAKGFEIWTGQEMPLDKIKPLLENV